MIQCVAFLLYPNPCLYETIFKAVDFKKYQIYILLMAINCQFIGYYSLFWWTTLSWWRSFMTFCTRMFSQTYFVRCVTLNLHKVMHILRNRLILSLHNENINKTLSATFNDNYLFTFYDLGLNLNDYRHMISIACTTSNYFTSCIRFIHIVVNELCSRPTPTL